MEDPFPMYCSIACQSKQISPVGTVKILTSTKPEIGFILVEIGVPSTDWEPKLEAGGGVIAQLDTRIKRQKQRDLRIQAIRKSTPPLSSHRVIIYTRDRQICGPFERFEYALPASDLADGIVDILDNDFESPYQVKTTTERDILVCTHAQRDQCCGTFGADLYAYLQDKTPHGVDIWMSSHLGGHRMAPTFLDLPYGRYWGYASNAISTKIVECQDLSNEEIMKHYRGIVGVPPAIQIADREGIKNSMWKWMQSSYTITIEHNQFSIVSAGGERIRGEILEPTQAPVGQTRCANLKLVNIPQAKITHTSFS